MEELSKQLSTQLNETICIEELSHTYLLTDKNNKIKISLDVLQNNLTIIEIYNQVREYKNNINKEFNLNSYIIIYYDEDNLIDQINLKIGKIEMINGDDYITAKDYLKLNEKLIKIIELKNKLESLYGKIEEMHNTEFELDIDNDIITISYCIYYYDQSNNLDLYPISITTNKILIYQIYNQFRNYINNFIKIFDIDNIKYESISINYKDNDISAINYCYKYDYIIDIRKNNNNFNFNIQSLMEFFEEIKTYSKELYLKINNYSILNSVSVIYSDDYLVKSIDIKYNKCHICANNYVELTEKVQNKLESDRLECENKLIMEFKKRLNKDIIVKQINKSSFIILRKVIGATEYQIKIYVNCIDDIDKIIKIYKEVKSFRENMHFKYNLDWYIETEYIDYNINKINIKYDEYIINANDYGDCEKNIKSYLIKKKQNEIKLKYGENAYWNIDCNNSYDNCYYDLKISVNTKYINLLDIVPNILWNKIVNGYIKNTNVLNLGFIINLTDHNENKDKKIIYRILVNNCPNLLNINNILELNKDRIYNNIFNLITYNCPKLEFIENYNNFTEIIINHRLVKVVNDEIKSLLKDQQEYARIIQSLLKRINKLESKAVENE